MRDFLATVANRSDEEDFAATVDVTRIAALRRVCRPMVRRPDAGVRFALAGNVARITLNRASRENRFTPATAIAFAEACERCEEDECRVVLLTAEGGSFCRGVEGPIGEWPAVEGADFVSALARVTRPVVAAVRGRVDAEGFELTLAADIRIAGPTARFSLPQVGRGELPCFGATQRLPRIVGTARALRLILLGEPLGAREALACGLIAEVSRRPEAAALRVARALAARAPVALRFAKEAVRRAPDLPLDDGARFEHDLYALLETTRDRAEGIRAFLEKRAPVFRGS